MSFIIYNVLFLFERVQIGTSQHLFPILIAVLFCVLFTAFAKRQFTKRQQEKLLHIFAWFISLTVITFHLYKISLGSYNLKTDLPLYLCSLMGLLIPLFTYLKKYWMYEILVFWIIAGTFQGVITPDVPIGFPSFDYFRYWIVHLGLIIIIFYATFVFKMQPKFKSVFKSFFALQLYIILMLAINYTLNANYFYLNKKPESASILDYFGEWPSYIFIAQLIIIPYFLLIYFTFYIFRRKQTM